MKKIQADVVVIGGGTAGMGAFRAARRHTDNVYLMKAMCSAPPAPAWAACLPSC